MTRNKRFFKYIHIHRLVLGLGDFKDDPRIVNHIDGNGLNNSKANLEICDTLHNTQSWRCHNKSTGCIYVERDGRNKKYSAAIMIYKKLFRKRFYTMDNAIHFLESKVAEVTA